MPAFLEGTLTQAKHESWLRRKAAVHVKRES